MYPSTKTPLRYLLVALTVVLALGLTQCQSQSDHISVASATKDERVKPHRRRDIDNRLENRHRSGGAGKHTGRGSYRCHPAARNSRPDDAFRKRSVFSVSSLTATNRRKNSNRS